jgi:1-acyl-sn-glycerol-3-phosphate acyltransferase
VWAFVTLAIIAASIFYNWRRSGKRLPAFIGLGVIRLYSRLWHGATFPMPLQAPEEGPAIVVVNHTSSPDGCFLQVGCKRGLTFLIAEEFFYKYVRWVWATTDCVPVNRSGADIRALRHGLQRLRDGRIVAVFPEGTLSGAGMGRLRTAKGGAAFLALRSRAPVFAAHISGGPQHPHVASGWLLPSPRRVRVVYSPQLDMTPFYDRPMNRALIEEVTAFLMKQIAALAPDCS